MTNGYEYYEVWPVRKTKNGGVERILQPSLEALEASGEKPDFWSLYGVYGGEAEAIGDFVSWEAAYRVMNLILAPLAEVRDVLECHACTGKGGILRHVEDIINQSSNEERF
mgnify:CR=1 FL=1